MVPLVRSNGYGEAMTEVDQRIANIKQRIESARIKQARAEASKQVAEEKKADALAVLKEKFGLDTVNEARAKLADLEKELKDNLIAIEEILGQLES